MSSGFGDCFHQIVDRMSFRCFAPSDEAIADQWSRETVTSETWTLGGPIGTGESGSINVTSAAATSPDKEVE
jgi:hypothetical protein